MSNQQLQHFSPDQPTREWRKVQGTLTEEEKTFPDLVTRHASSQVSSEVIDAARVTFHGLLALGGGGFEQAFRTTGTLDAARRS
jgi:hypothetical protein